MGITHREFLRGLPAALGGRPYVLREGTRVEVDGPEGRIVIRLGPQRERRIAALCLPVTRVEIELDGYSEAAVAAFIREFDMHFQRGGG
jgi:hypothetical protein